MKFLFFVLLASIALVEPSTQLLCYHCKSADYESADDKFNDKSLLVCNKDQEKWPIRNSTQLDFNRCKKVVEKIKVNGKDDVLVIRTIGPMKMNLNENLFTEYNCETDLCNSAVTMSTTAFAALLPVLFPLSSYL